jgi:photosystem II stability/assembly factor-like uncharacterized protein
LRPGPLLLPETIVSAQLQAGKLRLLGASGTLYVGASALGPVTAKLSPFDGARAAAASESALFVLDRASKLHRSVDGVAWSDVNLPGLAGVVTSVAMAGKHGLVTAVPPQLFATHDDGATFTLVTTTPSPVSQLVVDRDSVLARTANGWTRFDPTGAFVASPSPGLWSPRWPAHADLESALAASTVVEVQAGSNPALAVHALGTAETFHELRDVSGVPPCSAPHPAAAPGLVALRCDEGGATVVVTSTDEGRSFAPMAKLDVAGTTRPDHAALAVGPQGALFVGERCKDVWSKTCAPAVVRTVKDGPFVPVTQGAVLAAQWDGANGGFLIVAADPERTRLLRSSAKGLEDLGVLVPAESTRATMATGDGGSVGIVVTSGEDVAAFQTSGTGFRPVAVPPLRLRSGALAGTHGLLVAESGRAFESTDGASWHEVLAPAALRDVRACSSAGCLVDRGERVGWDDTATARPKARAAKGLRCKPAGPRAPSGSLPAPPRAGALDHGPWRIVLAGRDGDGGVRALRSGWADPPGRFATTELLGPGQPYPAYGTRAVVLTQTGGVAVARYTWKRIRFTGSFNPIGLEVAWLRDGWSAPHRTSATLPAYRSDTSFLDPAGESTTMPEVLALGQRGVHWRAPVVDDDLGVGRFFGDGGAVRKVPFAADVTGRALFVRGDDDAPMLALDHDGDVLVADVVQHRTHVVLPGVTDRERALVFADLGGKPVAIATDRRAGRSFAFPITIHAGIAGVELPTQRSLEGVAPCSGSAPGDPVDLPWTVGTRRAVRVVESGTERLFVTDRARVRVSGSALTCVTGWDAVPLDRTNASLLLVDGGAAGLLVEASPASNAGSTITPVACTPDDVEPSLAYGDVEGM